MHHSIPQIRIKTPVDRLFKRQVRLNIARTSSNKENKNFNTTNIDSKQTRAIILTAL